MKELSIEEKAKAYDEAIERAKVFKEHLLEIDEKDYANEMDYVFPALKESKDERVIKNIKKVIGWYRGMFTEKSLMPEEYQEIDAWLEKQGEQNPVNSIWHDMTENPEGDENDRTLVVFEDGYSTTSNALLHIGFGTSKPYKWAYVNDILRLTSNAKQSEQKSANFLQELEDKLANATPQQLAEWKEKYFKEEPAEWSEEDETTKNNISHIIRQYDKISKRENQPCYYVGDCLLWMQNIKGRVQPQPKHEWSEEDEENKKTLRFLAYENCDAEDASRLITWLENLKEQILHLRAVYEKPAELWKPTKEQIIALRWVLNNISYNKHKEEISGLLEDLKKMIDDR